VGSPKVLLLSGLGPKEHLEKIGIPVRSNIPGVGQNLQDHIYGIVPLVNTGNKGRFYGISVFAIINPINYLRILLFGEGPFTDNGVGFMAMINSNVTKRPEIQIHTWAFTFDKDYGAWLKKITGINDTYHNNLFGPYNTRFAYVIDDCDLILFVI
jgi:choline dehydrogenase